MHCGHPVPRVRRLNQEAQDEIARLRGENDLLKQQLRWYEDTCTCQDGRWQRRSQGFLLFCTSSASGEAQAHTGTSRAARIVAFAPPCFHNWRPTNIHQPRRPGHVAKPSSTSLFAYGSVDSPCLSNLMSSLHFLGAFGIPTLWTFPSLKVINI